MTYKDFSKPLMITTTKPFKCVVYVFVQMWSKKEWLIFLIAFVIIALFN